jgi:putative Holliday junction resolvase
MRYLAIDPGAKRTGLAVGDDETMHAGPVDTIVASDPAQLLRKIAEAIDEYEPDALVIGIPYNMDDTVGPAAKRAQALAMLLADHTGLPVHQFDERLTTYEANQRMAQSGLTHGQKKSRRDAIAAAALLEGFLKSDRSQDDAGS